MGVGVESLVGVCLEWLLKFIIFILVIFKVGGVYLFLDLIYFFEWLIFMVEDVGI